ncbi:MAG: L-seryl-tRNA(Sec) selenium transferase [Desulfovibrionaceae bacterium]|nr:L-seryl-tRNA(Sec) selenium transferase [Desulfovibrionaceae bacterium]
MKTLFQALPAMDVCLEALFAARPEWRALPRALVRENVTAYWNGVRADIKAGLYTQPCALGLDAQLPHIQKYVQAALRPRLRRAINAAGVVVHTNMGRSLLAQEAVQAVAQAAGHYTNLELDLSTGGRGSRYNIINDILCRLTGAEAALVVNNNAAAVLLVLDTLCKGGEVLVSRGELVEIGGSFRIPDIMEKSGAVLHEVGATNRTHIRDYAAALNENTRALMRVHTSNYRIVGFHKAVSVEELVILGRKHGLPVIEDLGSGSLIDFSTYGLPYEPTVQSVVAAGADIVTFSGDKVLGSAQAGIIVGKKKYIDALHANQLTRALRQDKLCLAALEATLRLYADQQTVCATIPTLRMITMTGQECAQRARKLARRLKAKLGERAHISIAEAESRVGGGAFPERGLATSVVRVQPCACSVPELKQRLLAADPPLIGRVEEDAFCLDPRTIQDKECADIVRVLDEALHQN